MLDLCSDSCWGCLGSVCVCVLVGVCIWFVGVVDVWFLL